MSSGLSYSIKPFYELDIHELYSLLKLRVDVFVVEQECPYPELDDKDQQAVHVIGQDEQGKLLVYARILSSEGDQPPSIGRIVVDEQLRGQGAGHALMEKCLDHLHNTYGSVRSKLSAQSHLKHFYEKHGYRVVSDEYPWDGIPHVDMILEPVSE